MQLIFSEIFHIQNFSSILRTASNVPLTIYKYFQRNSSIFWSYKKY